MVGTEVILSAVRREIHRAMQKPHKPSRVGLVSSYDPKQRAVKVQLQPEGTQTGWIPSRLAISRRRPDKPAEVQAGEYHFIHGSGSVLHFLQDVLLWPLLVRI